MAETEFRLVYDSFDATVDGVRSAADAFRAVAVDDSVGLESEPAIAAFRIRLGRLRDLQRAYLDLLQRDCARLNRVREQLRSQDEGIAHDLDVREFSSSSIPPRRFETIYKEVPEGGTIPTVVDPPTFAQDAMEAADAAKPVEAKDTDTWNEW